MESKVNESTDIHMEMSKALLQALSSASRMSERSRLEKVQETIEKGANVNVKGINDNTPLHLASSGGHISIVKFLLQRSEIDCGIKNSSKETALKKLDNILKKKKLKNRDTYVEIKKILEDHCGLLSNRPAVIRTQRAHRYENVVFYLLERAGREKLENNEFQVGREIKTRKTAEQKFDDTLFLYEVNDKKYVISIQIKHRGETKQGKICSRDFMKTGDFDVKKYFFSYLDLKNDIRRISTKASQFLDENLGSFQANQDELNENEANLKNAEVQYVVLFTSAILDVDELDKSGFELVDAPRGILDIFDLSLEVKEEPNRKQLRTINKKLSDSLYGVLSSFEEKNEWFRRLPEEQRANEIANFFACFVIVNNQPQVERLEWFFSNLNERDVCRNSPFKEVLSYESFQCYMNSLTNNFHMQGGRPSGWISREAVEENFSEYKQFIQTSLVVSCMTTMHEKNLYSNGRFKSWNASSKLEAFLESNEYRVLFIQTSVTLLSSIKLSQQLERNNQYKLSKCGRISVDLQGLEASSRYGEAIIEVFRLSSSNLLTIECNSIQKHSRFLTELIRVVYGNPHKKIIFIVDKDDRNRFVDNFIVDRMNSKLHLVDQDAVEIEKFDPKNNPMQKIFFLAGEEMSLAKLIGIDYWAAFLTSVIHRELISPRVMADLISNKQIQIGTKPLGISNLEGAYSVLIKEINFETLRANLLHSSSDVIFTLTGMHSSNEFLSNVDLETGDIDNNMNILCYPCSIPSTKGALLFVDDRFEEENFKQLCHDNPSKRIYWIKWDEPRFILQQVYNPDFYLERSYHQVVEKIPIPARKERELPSNCKNTFIIPCAEPETLDCIELFSINGHIVLVKCDDHTRNSKFAELGSKAYRRVYRDLQIVDKGMLSTEDNSITFTYEQVGNMILKIARFSSEHNLLQFIAKEQVVILADDPGMGKSTTAIKLYQSNYGQNGLLRLVDSHWILHIHLTDHVESMKRLEFVTGSEAVPQFLFTLSKNLECEFARSLLKLAMYRDKKIFNKTLLVVFDGFDELHDESDRSKVISLLKILKNDTNVKFWITTRLHYMETLEAALSINAIQFDPLDEDALTAFIRKYVANRSSLVFSEHELEIFDGTEPNNAKVKYYCKTFLDKLHSVFPSHESRFIGTPLQLCLLLEGSKSRKDSGMSDTTQNCLESFKRWINNTSREPEFSFVGSHPVEAYENFIHSKYENYFKKVGIISDSEKAVNSLLFNLFCRKLAGKLFKSSGCDTLRDNETIALAPGLIKSDGINLEFIHPTFGEYFASEICVNWIEKESKFPNSKKQEFLLREILVNNDYSVISFFINARLNNKVKSLKEKTMKEYGNILRNFLPVSHHQVIDTPLHSAVRHGHTHIMSFLFAAMEDDPETVEKFLLAPADHSKQTVLHLAINRRSVESVKLLLNFARKFSTNLLGKVLLNSQTVTARNVLHVAVGTGRKDVVTEILIQACNIPRENESTSIIEKLLLAEDRWGSTALSLVITHRYHEITLQLLSFAQNNQGVLKSLLLPNGRASFPLYFAAKLGDVEIVRELLSLARSVSICFLEETLFASYNGCTALHGAAEWVQMESINLLLKEAEELSGDNVDSDSSKLFKFIFHSNNDGHTAIHLICRSGYEETVEKSFATVRHYPYIWTMIMQTLDQVSLKVKLHVEIRKIENALSFKKYHVVEDILREHKDSRDRLQTIILSLKNETTLDTALHNACREGEYNLVRILLTYAKNVDDDWETFRQLLESVNIMGRKPFDQVEDYNRVREIMSEFSEYAK